MMYACSVCVLSSMQQQRPGKQSRALVRDFRRHYVLILIIISIWAHCPGLNLELQPHRIQLVLELLKQQNRSDHMRTYRQHQVTAEAPEKKPRYRVTVKVKLLFFALYLGNKSRAQQLPFRNRKTSPNYTAFTLCFGQNGLRTNVHI